MSKEKRFIEISPGLMSPGGKMTDQVESQGHICPYCQAQSVEAAVSLMQ